MSRYIVTPILSPRNILNIEKLKARYPEGFDPEHSLHRAEGDI